jgi:hypothetical protein
MISYLVALWDKSGIIGEIVYRTGIYRNSLFPRTINDHNKHYKLNRLRYKYSQPNLRPITPYAFSSLTPYLFPLHNEIENECM